MELQATRRAPPDHVVGHTRRHAAAQLGTTASSGVKKRGNRKEVFLAARVDSDASTDPPDLLRCMSTRLGGGGRQYDRKPPTCL